MKTYGNTSKEYINAINADNTQRQCLSTSTRKTRNKTDCQENLSEQSAKKLRNDVQDDPTHLNDQVVSDHTETFNTQAEPHRERDPCNDKEEWQLPEVRIAVESTLLTLTVLPNLQDVVVEHDAGQTKAKAIPTKAQGIPCEHGSSSTKQHRHGQEWHHEATIAGYTSTCKNYQLQLHNGTCSNPLNRTRQVETEVVLSTWRRRKAKGAPWGPTFYDPNDQWHIVFAHVSACLCT